MNEPIARRLAPALLTASLVFAGVVPGGCTAWFGRAGGGELQTRSGDGSAVLEPALPIAVYATSRAAVADFYLTGIPLSRLSDLGDDLAGVSGQIVHVHAFLKPEWGSTPSNPAACTTTVRQVILARGAIGVYSGAGFAVPDEPGEPAEPTLGIDLEDLSLRLTARTDDFADQLGPCTMSGTVSASHDEGASRAIAGRLQELMGRVKKLN